MVRRQPWRLLSLDLFPRCQLAAFLRHCRFLLGLAEPRHALSTAIARRNYAFPAEKQPLIQPSRIRRRKISQRELKYSTMAPHELLVDILLLFSFRSLFLRRLSSCRRLCIVSREPMLGEVPANSFFPGLKFDPDSTAVQWTSPEPRANNCVVLRYSEGKRKGITGKELPGVGSSLDCRGTGRGEGASMSFSSNNFDDCSAVRAVAAIVHWSDHLGRWSCCWPRV